MNPGADPMNVRLPMIAVLALTGALGLGFAQRW